jgi:hypothetical protein
VYIHNTPQQKRWLQINNDFYQQHNKLETHEQYDFECFEKFSAISNIKLSLLIFVRVTIQSRHVMQFSNKLAVVMSS